MSETRWPKGEWGKEWSTGSEMYEIGPLQADGSIDWTHEIAATCGDSREEHEAIANLIIAAPDLYAALAEIVAEWGRPNTPKWHRARTALAKARGEQP